MPTPRYHANAEVLNGRIYVVSGIVAGGNTTPVVEVYDPATNTWSTATDVTTERSAGAIGVVNGILYLAGGSSNNTVTGVLEAYVP
jgi:N-acetylneuraminic acid mutarotase